MRIFIKSFFVFVIISILSACASLPEAQSNWQTHKPKLDEIYNLTQDSARMLGEQNVLYTVSNDSANLYIKMMIVDRETQKLLMRNGMTLWIDTTGKKKQKLGIVYPLSAKENKGLADFNQGNEQGINIDKAAKIAFQKRLLLSMIEMDLVGFEGNATVRKPALNPEGPSVSILVDSFGALQYKAIIPFSKMHYNPLTHRGKKSVPLSVGMVINPSDDEGGHYGGKGAHGGSFGNGGALPGAGMPGGAVGESHGVRNQGSESERGYDIWVHVKMSAR
jgi:hypothetical protein